MGDPTYRELLAAPVNVTWEITGRATSIVATVFRRIS